MRIGIFSGKQALRRPGLHLAKHGLMLRIRGFLGPLLVWTLAAGCTSTASYRRPSTPTEAASILAEPGKREVALVVAFPKGSEVRRGTLAPFDAHKFVFTEASGQRSSVLFQQTRSITYQNPGKGALVGALIGFIPGFLAGYVVGHALTTCDDSSGGDYEYHRSCTSASSSLGTSMAFGATSGLLSAGIGAAIGAALTYKRTITF